MLRGKRVTLRPMRPEDVARDHEFHQDVQLYGLDCDYPHVVPLEKAQAEYEALTRRGDEVVSFAVEAGGKYIGGCSLMDLQNRHGNLELGIMIGDRAYWGREFGREVVGLLLE